MAGELERKPPQAVEAEAAILGAMLLDPEVVPLVLERLNEEHFYVAGHRLIFKAIAHLSARNTPTDIITVGAELRRNGELEAIGGAAFLSSLVDNILTTTHVEEHCRLVLEKAVQRRLINIASQLAQESFDGKMSSDELLNHVEQELFSIKERHLRGGFVLFSREILGETIKQVEELQRKGGKWITGVATGYRQLDEMTSGFQPGDLVVIASRPSMGKTALALNIGMKIATNRERPRAVGMFSLEMSTPSLVQRLICSEAGVDLRRLRAGKLSRDEWTRLSAALGPLHNALFYIDDSPAPRVIEIMAKARRLKAQVDVGLFIVDYLQLIEASPESRRLASRQQEITEISRSLKAMAKELEVPVVALSQLSRAPEKRAPTRPEPQLADLRESGAIEQDADLVIMLYRDEVYRKEESQEKGKAKIIIAKQRNGPVGAFYLAFNGEYMRFDELSLLEEPPPAEEGL